MHRENMSQTRVGVVATHREQYLVVKWKAVHRLWLFKIDKNVLNLSLLCFQGESTPFCVDQLLLYLSREAF